MKRLFTGLLILTGVSALTGTLLGLSATKVWAKTLKGSGLIVSKNIAVSDFRAIDASRAVKVIVAEPSQQEIRIEADDNVIDLVTVRVNKGTLKIGIDPSVQSLSSIDVTVTVPDNGRIASLEASSAAKIIVRPTLEADRFEIDASSAAKIEAAVKARTCRIEAESAAKVIARVRADECAVEATSAAKIDADVQADECAVEATSAATIALSGSAARCKADMQSASKLSAAEFTVKAYDIETSSAAKAEIRCTETLQADASSGSSIRYEGECTKQIARSSGAKISRK